LQAGEYAKQTDPGVASCRGTLRLVVEVSQVSIDFCKYIVTEGEGIAVYFQVEFSQFGRKQRVCAILDDLLIGFAGQSLVVDQTKFEFVADPATVVIECTTGK